jgi:hypothetical protein
MMDDIEILLVIVSSMAYKNEQKINFTKESKKKITIKRITIKFKIKTNERTTYIFFY